MRHAAQTAASKEFVTSSFLKINFNKSGVIGFFRVTRSPKWRLIPFKILFTQKLSLIGFGSPNSKSNNRIIFKYCFTELNCRERAKKDDIYKGFATMQVQEYIPFYHKKSDTNVCESCKLV